MDQAAVELPKWRCHKIVRAAKITDLHVELSGARFMLGEIGGAVDVDNVWIGKHGNTDMVGCYYVVYEDGYTSLSPAKAFEEGYAPLVLTKGDADADLAGTPRPDNPTLPPHQQRVIKERAELEDRLDKLTAFLTTPTFESLPVEEQDRLVRQSGVMVQLSDVLAERIAAF